MPKTVLLADDSLTIQRVVTLTFANEDVTITSVSDGDQAVESLSRSRPDLVLADIAMPGRSGYQVVEYVRSQPELSSLPVLLLAGAFDRIDEVHVRTVGADGVLTKPFEPSALIGQVKHLLATGRAHPAAVVQAKPARTPIAALAAPIEHPVPVETPVPVEPQAPVEPRALVEPLAPVRMPTPVETPAPVEMHAPIEVPAPVEVVMPVAIPAPVETHAPVVGDAQQTALDTPLATLETKPSLSPEVALVSVESAAPITPEPEAPSTSSPVAPPPVETPAVDSRPVTRMPGSDSYFDQIDQAFAALAKAPRQSLNLVPKPPAPVPAEERDAMVAAVTESKLLPIASSGADPEAPARTVPLSDAFNALLDAERAGVIDTTSRLPGVPAFSPVDLDALATQVAHRVLEQMADRVVRETVADIVSHTAERMVREEIEQVKRHIT